MKKLIYTMVILAFAVSLNAQWQQFSNGIDPNYMIRSFLLNGNILFAGSEGVESGPGNGVYISNNYGASWTYSGLSPNNVNCLAQSGTNIFAGTRAAGIFRSTNNGGSWTAVNNGLTAVRFDALFVIGTTILAGANQGGGAFRSTNNGTSWTASGLTGQSVFDFAISGTNIFAGTSTGVSVSTNNGISWTLTSYASPYVRSIVISGTNIFAAGDGGVIKLSTNNGASWTSINSGLPSIPIFALAVIGSNLFAGFEGEFNPFYGVYFSTNNGTSWAAKNEGFNSIPPIFAFIIANNFIYAGTSARVWGRNLTDFIGIKQISEVVPSSYSLSQNYPNPFNPTTKIKFDVVRVGDVKIIVYDVMGREVETLVNESLKPGTYEATFDASQLTSGVYFYKITAGDFSETKKMLLVK